MTRSGNPKEFFSDKNTRLFDNAEYTKEVERRVGVFREALSKFHQLHEIFSEAVKETILNVKPLDQYIQE